MDYTSVVFENQRKAFDLAHKASQNPSFSGDARAIFRAIRRELWLSAGGDSKDERARLSLAEERVCQKYQPRA
jgi:hypothetical protein